MLINPITSSPQPGLIGVSFNPIRASPEPGGVWALLLSFFRLNPCYFLIKREQKFNICAKRSRNKLFHYFVSYFVCHVYDFKLFKSF